MEAQEPVTVETLLSALEQKREKLPWGMVRMALSHLAESGKGQHFVERAHYDPSKDPASWEEIEFEGDLVPGEACLNVIFESPRSRAAYEEAGILFKLEEPVNGSGSSRWVVKGLSNLRLTNGDLAQVVSGLPLLKSRGTGKER